MIRYVIITGFPPDSRRHGTKIPGNSWLLRLFLMVSRKFSPGYLFYYIRPRVKRVIIMVFITTPPRRHRQRSLWRGHLPTPKSPATAADPRSTISPARRHDPPRWGRAGPTGTCTPKWVFGLWAPPEGETRGGSPGGRVKFKVARELRR